ncbi:MAG TPA: PKD domain-containing protein [Ktedonobacterales bacterium]
MSGGEHIRASARQGRMKRWTRTLALAALMAVGLAVWSAGGMPGRVSAYDTLRACGLGASATMVANNAPALAYEQSKVSQGVPLGIFALDFQARQQITFYDDLSRVANAPNPNSVRWKWNYGDGSTPGYAYKPSHTYTAAGSYTVSVYIQDPLTGDWGDPFDHAVLNVATSTIANPPVAMARAVTSPVIAMGSKVTFDAAGSHAVVGSDLKYDWNFGDFSVASGSHVTHEFDQQGHGLVTLTATDSRGAKAIAQVPVVIVQSLQPATFTASPQRAPAGASISFDASQTTPPAGEPVAVAWNFGDGSAMMTGPTPTITHSYAKAGTYTVTVAVYGQQDTVGSVGTLTVTALPDAVSAGGGGGLGLSLPLIIGLAVIVVAAIIGAVVWTSRRQMALERAAQARMELARARRVNAPRRPDGRGGPDPRDPRRGAPAGRSPGHYDGRRDGRQR